MSALPSADELFLDQLHRYHKCPNCGRESDFVVQGGKIVELLTDKQLDIDRSKFAAEQKIKNWTKALLTWINTWVDTHTNVTPAGPIEPPQEKDTSCGGYNCTNHTCMGASCAHCKGTGRCPEFDHGESK